MSKTTYRVDHESKIASVSFDVEEDESATIELDFTLQDLLAVINMVTFRKTKIDLEAIRGFASLPGSSPGQDQICFSYSNAPGDFGTVFHPYARVCEIFEKALSELNRGSASDD